MRGVSAQLCEPLSENQPGLYQPHPHLQGLHRWGLPSAPGRPSLQTPAMCQGSPGHPASDQLPTDSELLTTPLKTDNSLAHRTQESVILTISFLIKNTNQDPARREMHRELGGRSGVLAMEPVCPLPMQSGHQPHIITTKQLH